jgi:peptidoglycan L-alanyl-D-glutamate endopeptidase CwlK
MSTVLGQRSLARLEGVHPDLVRVVKKAAILSNLDFAVLEGLRTIERQKQLVSQGASKTMNSRHLTGHAVDLAPMIGGKISWDWPLYHQFAKVVKSAAADEKVPLQWGGDWRAFKDGPHWELPWAFYPKGK